MIFQEILEISDDPDILLARKLLIEAKHERYRHDRMRAGSMQRRLDEIARKVRGKDLDLDRELVQQIAILGRRT
jgi:hypothetical protein